MIAFTAAVEPLRLANRVSGRELYAWRLFSADGGPVRAESHPEIDLCIGGHRLGAYPEEAFKQLPMRHSALVECDVEGAETQQRSH